MTRRTVFVLLMALSLVPLTDLPSDAQGERAKLAARNRDASGWRTRLGGTHRCNGAGCPDLVDAYASARVGRDYRRRRGLRA